MCSLNSFYYLFFLHMILIICMVDLVPYYPPALVPAPFQWLSTFYITTFRDPMVISQPPWFVFFVVTEAFIQLPIAIYMVLSLKRKNQPPSVPLWGFVYGFLAAFSTYACLCEIWWDGIKEDKSGKNLLLSAEQKLSLVGCYGPYAAVFTIMTIDFGYKICKALGAAEKAVLEKKGN